MQKKQQKPSDIHRAGQGAMPRIATWSGHVRINRKLIGRLNMSFASRTKTPRQVGVFGRRGRSGTPT